jgi:predicted nuclease of predicted toxin-antitoxin system
MKLLLDGNLSRRIVPFLQHEFPGTSQVTLLGLESASDQDIWLRAKKDGYVAVTREADFQECCTGAPAIGNHAKRRTQ